MFLRPNLLEVHLDPVLRVVVPLETDVAAPEERAARLVLLRDRRRLTDDALHLQTVDVPVFLVLGGERHLIERVLA